MPPDHYPPGWNQFSARIRFERAQSRCECTGQCGLHGGPSQGRRCTEIHHKPARWFKGTVRLTVAHLCNCNPICLNPLHVRAMCQRCHLRVDRFIHAMHRQHARRPQDAQEPHR
jgi:hypothetical protein